jgi:hypothetical protein
MKFQSRWFADKKRVNKKKSKHEFKWKSQMKLLGGIGRVGVKRERGQADDIECV